MGRRANGSSSISSSSSTSKAGHSYRNNHKVSNGEVAMPEETTARGKRIDSSRIRATIVATETIGIRCTTRGS